MYEIFMDRSEAVNRLRELKRRNLRQVAQECGVYTSESGAVNPSWIVNTLEVTISLPENTLYDTTFYDTIGPWKIEWVPQTNIGDRWEMTNEFVVTRIKESNPLPDFLDSGLYNWITRQIIVGVGAASVAEERESVYIVTKVSTFDAKTPENRIFLEEIEADYNLVRAILQREDGYSMLTGYLGKWLDPPLTDNHAFGVMNYWFHTI